MASIFLIITFSCIVAGGLWLAFFILTLCILGSKEFISFANAKGINPSNKLIYFSITVLILASARTYLYKYAGLALTLLVIASMLGIMMRGKKATIADVSTTIFGFMYGGWLPAHIVALRDITGKEFTVFGHHYSNGLGYLLLMFLVITISDIAGYYVGTKFGKAPLCPEISPKKTIAGAIGSTVGGILIAMAVGKMISLLWYQSLLAGIVLSASAQLGDLVESMLKRDAGFKDSGNLLPGHGGVLDRADSYILTGAVAYYFFSLFILGL